MMDGKNSLSILGRIGNCIFRFQQPPEWTATNRFSELSEPRKLGEPKLPLVCIGDYPIKVLLNQPYAGKTDETLTILLGKSEKDIVKWIPKSFSSYFILGFEDSINDTHFWYNVLPFISADETLIENLKKQPIEKLHSAVMVASVWDGIGSASLPTLISKFKALNINALSLAILPSKIQPSDAYFNSLASLGNCKSIDGSTVLLIDRDLLENYEGIDRAGGIIKGNIAANYMINLMLSKESIVEEISELSRTFNVKMFASLLATGASIKIYGSIENMLDAVMLKPLLNFDLSTASLLYVLIRMPLALKDKLPSGKIELAITSWFKEKADLKSIFITEPIYVDDTSDRIDMILFIGGFDTSKMFADFEKKSMSLVNYAVEKGFIKKEDWQKIMEK